MWGKTYVLKIRKFTGLPVGVHEKLKLSGVKNMVAAPIWQCNLSFPTAFQ